MWKTHDETHWKMMYTPMDSRDVHPSVVWGGDIFFEYHPLKETSRTISGGKVMTIVYGKFHLAQLEIYKLKG